MWAARKESPMPLNMMDLLQPVYQTILAAYTQPPMQGLPPGNRESDIFLTLNWPGLEIDEQQYGNAWSPQNPSGSQDAVENISLLADAIPVLDPRYEWSGNSVESIYRQILEARPLRSTAVRNTGATNNVSLNDFSLAVTSEDTADAVDISPFLLELGRRTDVSVTTEAGPPVELVSVSEDTFKEAELQAAYSDAAASLNAKRMQFNLADPQQLQQWQASAPQYEAAVKSAWQALQTHQNQPARRAKRLGLGETNAVSAPMFDDVEVADNPILNAFTQAKSIFQNSKLASAKNPQLSYHPTYVTPANFADPKAAKSWPSIQIIPTQIRSNSGTANSNVAFKFLRVNFIRPWLLPSLLKLSGWQVQGMSPGYLSNGMNENNYGQFALLPTAMIVVRELSITPLGTNASDSDSYQILKSPGLQVLAWINKVIPFSPPAQ
jgi:hypothetical protein